MLAALGTLPFLATLWLLTVLGARILEESGAKIAAALKGETARAQPPVRYGRSRNGGYSSVTSTSAYATTRLCQRSTPST